MTHEEATKKLREIRDDYWDDDGYGGVTRSYVDGITAIDIAIEALEGHKTGKWVLADMGDTDLYKCSLCQSRKRHKTPFCCMCGAKMGVDE